MGGCTSKQMQKLAHIVEYRIVQLNNRIVAKGRVFQHRKESSFHYEGKTHDYATPLWKPSDPQSQIHPRVVTMPLDDAVEVSTAKGPLNKHYQDDMSRTVKYPRLFLSLLGVWQLLSREFSPARKCTVALVIVGGLMVLSFIIVPPLLDIILIEKDTRVRLIKVGATSFHIANFFKYGLFLLRFKTIRICVEHVETDWKSIVTEGDKAIMRSNAKIARTLTIICCTFSWSVSISYHAISPVATGNTINEMNETVRPLAFPGYDFFLDSQSTPTYEFIYFTICVGAFVSYNVTSASCSFTAVFALHACGLLQIVTSRLENLVNSIENEKNDDQVKELQSFIPRYHDSVLRLASKIEEVIREICFMEVIASTLIICSVEYYLVNEWGNNDAAGIVTYCIALVSNSCNILMFCYIGELLKDQGIRVSETAYMIDWYKLPCKSSHDLLIILIMGNNRPPKITAGRIFELSIRSFGSIIRMSVTYCNVLRTMTD